MKCGIHSEREAVGVCAHCGKTICAECCVEVGEKKYCKDCVSKTFGDEKSPGLSTQVPDTYSRKLLIVINYIMVLWTLIISLRSIFVIISGSTFQFDSVLLVSYLIMFVTFFYISYAMLKFSEKSKIVYSTFIGFVAVLILLVGIVSDVKYDMQYDMLDGMLGFIVLFAFFALIPLLVYLADFGYAKS